MTEPISPEVALRILTELKAIRAQWRSLLGGQDPDELEELSRAIDRAIERLASDMDPKEVLQKLRTPGGLEAAEITLEGLPEDLR